MAEGPDLPLPGTAHSDAELMERLRLRDEAAFTELVDRHHRAMLRLALPFVHDEEVAAEVVQDAWVAALKGIDAFEGRSSFKTWLSSIVVNVARASARKEMRAIAFSSAGLEGDEPALDASRFSPGGAWASIPDDWEAIPEQRLLSIETRTVIDGAISALPTQQRAVIELRDVSGWSADEVCNTLELTETNQRVLLHRARAKVRRALETYLA